MQKQARLETREARRKLPPRHEPYWRSVGKGLAVGYRRPAHGAASWYVRRFNGKSYSKRVLGGGTDDEHPADGQLRLAWADALRIAMDEPKHAVALKRRYTAADAVQSYFRHRAARSRSTDATSADRERLNGFVEKFGDTFVAELTTAELQDWRDSLVGVPDPKLDDTARREWLRQRQSTINRTWSICKAALNHSFTTGRVDSDVAWRRIRNFAAVDKPRTRFLSVDEAQKLLAACKDDFRPLAYGALLTGLRLGELVRLTAADIGTKDVQVAAGKTGRGRVVPLTPEGADLFAALAKNKAPTDLLFLDFEGKPWQKMHISRRMKSANKAAALSPRATFHDLRRSYGSLLANAGARDEIIAAALGHSDTRMTRKTYAHLLHDVVATEISARLPRFDGAAPPAKRKQAASRHK